MALMAATIDSQGEMVEWFQLQSDETYVSQGNIKVLSAPLRADEVFIEGGYGEDAFMVAATTAAIAHRDRLIIAGQTWEVLPPTVKTIDVVTIRVAQVRRVTLETLFVGKNTGHVYNILS